jgi:endo-1,4-beta-xylanase
MLIKHVYARFTMLIAAFCLIMTSCGAPVAVTNISGVPGSAYVGTELTLTGTVEPEGAANTAVVWSVSDAGPTGAEISPSAGAYVLNATAMGTVMVTATIKDGIAPGRDYTQDFTITVGEVSVPVPVVNISGVPDSAVAGTHVILSGIVAPDDATNQTIVWSLEDAGNTSAELKDGNTFSPAAPGNAVIRATITYGTDIGMDYTQDFTIKVSMAGIPVTGMTIPPKITMTVGDTQTLSPTVKPSDATNKTVTWSAGNPGVVTVRDGFLTAVSEGVATVTATSDDGGFVSTCEVIVQPAPAPSSPSSSSSK